jgi:DNA repair protein SbcD/Mre11
MRDWCFVHAADLHLDTPFTGIRGESPRMARLLRDASLEVLDRLVEVAIAREAAFVVLAGDLYDGSQRGLRAQVRFHDALERLDAAGIATLVTHGNHDPVEEGWQAVMHWPERVTIFPTDEVASVPVMVDGEVAATVHGISYATRAVRENLARRFVRTDAEGVHVGVLHATVGATTDHEPYAPCSLEDLRATRMDYWALGHIHRRRILHRGTGRGDPWVVYSGNTQGRSPKPSERGPKGCLVVPVTPAASGSPIGEPEFVPLDAVRFAELELDLEGLDAIPQILDGLDALAREALEEAEGRALVLRARLTGRSPLHAELARPGAVSELLDALNDGTRDASPPRWWDRLRDSSRPVLDRRSLAARADFTGDLVRTVDRFRADPALLDELAADADEIIDHLRPEPEHAELEELLEAAEHRALDLLDEQA